MNTHVFLLSILTVCVLTNAKIFDHKLGTELIVVTGSDNTFDYPDSEVIDLESHTGGDCNGWTNFPIQIGSATGALFNIESANETKGNFLLIDIRSIFYLTPIHNYIF